LDQTREKAKLIRANSYPGASRPQPKESTPRRHSVDASPHVSIDILNTDREYKKWKREQERIGVGKAQFRILENDAIRRLAQDGLVPAKVASPLKKGWKKLTQKDSEGEWVYEDEDGNTTTTRPSIKRDIRTRSGGMYTPKENDDPETRMILTPQQWAHVHQEVMNPYWRVPGKLGTLLDNQISSVGPTSGSLNTSSTPVLPSGWESKVDKKIRNINFEPLVPRTGSDDGDSIPQDLETLQPGAKVQMYDSTKKETIEVIVEKLANREKQSYWYKDTTGKNGLFQRTSSGKNIKRSRRRRVMERLLRYENHYSSGAEGYPPKDPYYSA